MSDYMDSDENISHTIKGTIGKIARFDQSEISDDTLIRDELGVDSLMGIEILAKIEKYYDISINESSLLDVERVGEFVSLIESKLDKK
ncbi:MAG: hypothetical protein DRP60_01495 [Spirochaetes bacterium]|nr:MAG: hypothetical protein DRP60_01495 [Spirochaetota bacterium]